MEGIDWAIILYGLPQNLWNSVEFDRSEYQGIWENALKSPTLFEIDKGLVAAAQVILMAGLQGVGKTTACGKLALALQKRNKRVLMVATDVYRPAAINQLVSLGQRIKVAGRIFYVLQCYDWKICMHVHAVR